ncbi:hypothetical protein AB0D87_36865 [Streptomyces sp. NPDC048342]|uniref:hypothetical protein n=1 Tax=Streptomyces sp. NPDC048342 TaxID=3154716 RepID=UPI00343DC52C
MLLQRRRDTGQYALPSGAMDIGESPTQCSVRECRGGDRSRCHPHRTPRRLLTPRTRGRLHRRGDPAGIRGDRDRTPRRWPTDHQRRS